MGRLIGYIGADGLPIAARTRRAALRLIVCPPLPSPDSPCPTLALVRVFYEPSIASRSDDVAYATG